MRSERRARLLRWRAECEARIAEIESRWPKGITCFPEEWMLEQQHYRRRVRAITAILQRDERGDAGR